MVFFFKEAELPQGGSVTNGANLFSFLLPILEREKEVNALLGGLTNICMEGESTVSTLC